MSPLKATNWKPSDGVSIPRWMALILGFFVWLVAIPLAHGVLPWVISLILPRYGWAEGRPGILNLLGLIPTLIGATGLIWIMIVGFAQAPESVTLEWNTTFLLMRGPYAFTRNPMYLSELGLWLGWAFFYGSIPVFIGFVILCAVIDFVVLPREERALETRFGEAYFQYKRTVPRWIGKARR